MPEQLAANQLTDQVFWDWRYQHSVRTRVGWLRGLLRRDFDRVLTELIDQVDQPSAEILELGCAPGRVLQRIGRLRPEHRLHGVDYSDVGVETAHRWLSQAGVDATIHQGDFRTLELPAEYDLVLSVGLVEHFHDVVPVLQQHARFCRPGGYVAATVPNFATPINRFLMRQLDPIAVPAHNLEIMDEGALQAAFKQAGLQEVRTGSADGPWIYPGADRRSRLGWVYRRAAKVWNAAAALLPLHFLWQYTIWATGRVPTE